MFGQKSSHLHTCESCTASFYKSSQQYPKIPYQLAQVASNRFFRTYPVNDKCGQKQVVCQLPSYCTPLLAPPEPICMLNFPSRASFNDKKSDPAGTSRARRKSTKIMCKPISRPGKCALKKVLERKKPLKSPTPCQSFNRESSRHNMTPVQSPSPFCLPQRKIDCSTKISYISLKKSCPSKVEEIPSCDYSEFKKNEPSFDDVEASESFCDQTETNYSCEAEESVEAMSKACDKNISDYCYDNPSLKCTTAKKVSGCAELLECMDEDTELWVLQVPKCFDVNRILNQNLGKRKTSNGSRLDVCCNRFNSCVNMICLAPEKAAEYKTVCDQIKLINPVGKIMVTEEESRVQSDVTCSDGVEDEEVPCDINVQRDLSPVACKKVQKKVNDQRFTIETTVTVENVGNDRCKKARKSIKQEPIDPSDVSEESSETSPTKRKTKKF